MKTTTITRAIGAMAISIAIGACGTASPGQAVPLTQHLPKLPDLASS